MRLSRQVTAFFLCLFDVVLLCDQAIPELIFAWTFHRTTSDGKAGLAAEDVVLKHIRRNVLFLLSLSQVAEFGEELGLVRLLRL